MQTDIETGICVRCGIPTEQKFGDIYICDDCYITRCSCCPEFGPDDLSTEAMEGIEANNNL